MDKYSTLTREELLAISQEQQKEIDELKAEIERMRTPPPNDWHSWMDALLHIMLYPHKSVKIWSEAKLGVQPPRADFVVVNEDKLVDLGFEIFDIFREHNIIEFKSPDDELSVFTICKGIGYVEFYIYVMHENGIDVNLDQVTLTFVRDARPDKLLKELADYVEEGSIEGIYYIKNWSAPDFPIQIIHSAVLKGDKYAGLRVISDDPSVDDIGEMFTIRQYQPVLQHIHLQHIVHIHNETLADTSKKHVATMHVCFQCLEHLRQIHAHFTLQFVGQHDIGIVAIGFKINDVRHIQTKQFVAGIEINQVLLHGSLFLKMMLYCCKYNKK